MKQKSVIHTGQGICFHKLTACGCLYETRKDQVSEYSSMKGKGIISF